MKIGWFFFVLLTGLSLFTPEGLPASTPVNPGLTLGQTASLNTAIVGDVFSFQITLTNTGDPTITSVTVRDALPAGVQYEASAGPGTYDPAAGQWSVSPGNAGTISTLTIEVMAVNTGTVTNTATLTSSAGPTASVMVAVGLTTPPLVLNYPSNITVSATTAGGGAVEFGSLASGGCSSPLTISAIPPSGSTFSIGTTPVSFTANDSCGDSTNGSFTVTVLPAGSTPIPLAKPISGPIVLTCSSNLTITASTPNGTNVYFGTSASGGCGSPLTLSSSPPSGSTFPIGQTTVTTTASDNCGDSTNCSFTITVNQQAYQPIVLTCSSNLTITASTPNGTNVYFTTSAYGGCSSPLNLSSSPPSGSTFPIGQTTVTTTASDNCGNVTNCTFTVTVNRQTYPAIVLTCSSNLTITASTPNGTNVYFTTSAYGGCSSPLNLSSSPPSGSTFPIGQTTVTTTASDSCGNTTNCTFTVTVNRQTYPAIVLTCSSNLTITASTPNGTNVYFTTSAYGGCSSPLNLSSSPPSGSTFPIGQTTVTTTASDSCGNTTNCTFTVTVNRQTYPAIVLTCSSNLTITASTPNGTNVYFTTSAYGGCSSPLNLSSSPPSGSTFPIGQTTVTTTASDNCGDITNCFFTITVTPQNAPASPLRINITGNQLLLSWPASLAGYVLESSPELFSPTWNPVTNPPVFNSTGQTVLLPLTSTQQFFQLLPP